MGLGRADLQPANDERGKMSIFSDYRVGALSDEEYRDECACMNRQDRWENEHECEDEEYDG